MVLIMPNFQTIYNIQKISLVEYLFPTWGREKESFLRIVLAQEIIPIQTLSVLSEFLRILIQSVEMLSEAFEICGSSDSPIES